MTDINTNNIKKMPGNTIRILIAGGGTGGHIFPAIAIANALTQINAKVEILFVGAIGKMEMEKVPQAGYKIKGIHIAGFNRTAMLKNIKLPYLLLKSFIQVNKIFNQFNPTAVIGTGGYSSYPVLKTAQNKKIPTFILEPNSFAGKSNQLLGKKAIKIFCATDGMENFFPSHKILVTGNPIRNLIANANLDKADAVKYFNLSVHKKILLVIGGSLGALSINETINAALDSLIENNIQIIWQTGKQYASIAKTKAQGNSNVWVNDFIQSMEYAFRAADLVVSRAGAITVSELCVAGKPVIFVPYPFAAEDHQTANANHLVKKQAAICISDKEVKTKLADEIIALNKDEALQKNLIKNISALAVKNADVKIAEFILNYIN